jgi:hypothetical protein
MFMRPANGTKRGQHDQHEERADQSEAALRGTPRPHAASSTLSCFITRSVSVAPFVTREIVTRMSSSPPCSRLPGSRRQRACR